MSFRIQLRGPDDRVVRDRTGRSVQTWRRTFNGATYAYDTYLRLAKRDQYVVVLENGIEVERSK